jgi:imidazolonepropionase-like amidohydrolase
MVDRKATICLLSLAATFITVVSVAPQTRTLAITRVNVVDVVDGRIVPNNTVTIRGKTIASVGQNSAPSGDAEIVDGQGKFVPDGCVQRVCNGGCSSRRSTPFRDVESGSHSTGRITSRWSRRARQSGAILSLRRAAQRER